MLPAPIMINPAINGLPPSRIYIAPRMPLKAITEGIERSIPPAISTAETPTAINASAVDCERTLIRFCPVRKSRTNMPITRITTVSNTNGSNRSILSRLNPNRGGIDTSGLIFCKDCMELTLYRLPLHNYCIEYDLSVGTAGILSACHPYLEGGSASAEYGAGLQQDMTCA